MKRLDLLRTGAIVLGVEPLTNWRPEAPELRAITDAVALVAKREGVAVVDVGLVADVLRDLAPEVPLSLVHEAMLA